MCICYQEMLWKDIFGNNNGNTRIWHFDLLEMAKHQSRQVFYCNPTLTCSVTDEKRNLENQKLKIKQNFFTGKCRFFLIIYMPKKSIFSKNIDMTYIINFHIYLYTCICIFKWYCTLSIILMLETLILWRFSCFWLAGYSSAFCSE